MSYLVANNKMVIANNKYLTVSNGVYDYDGNLYTYVTIGTQQWIVGNLKTTHYANGVPITNITVNASWASYQEASAGAYSWKNNDYDMYNEYGALYNWYAVDNSNGLSIDGWRIPSKTDLDTLATYLGSDPGGKLKEVGTEHWTPDNIGATDMYGFKSIGGGDRMDNTGNFDHFNTIEHLWTSTSVVANPSDAWVRLIANNTTNLTSGSDDKIKGNHVRCMRDA